MYGHGRIQPWQGTRSVSTFAYVIMKDSLGNIGTSEVETIITAQEFLFSDHSIQEQCHEWVTTACMVLETGQKELARRKKCEWVCIVIMREKKWPSSQEKVTIILNVFSAGVCRSSQMGANACVGMHIHVCVCVLHIQQNSMHVVGLKSLYLHGTGKISLPGFRNF